MVYISEPTIVYVSRKQDNQNNVNNDFTSVINLYDGSSRTRINSGTSGTTSHESYRPAPGSTSIPTNTVSRS
jgi:hypothetical protein